MTDASVRPAREADLPTLERIYTRVRAEPADGVVLVRAAPSANS